MPSAADVDHFFEDRHTARYSKIEQFYCVPELEASRGLGIAYIALFLSAALSPSMVLVAVRIADVSLRNFLSHLL